MNDFMQFWDSFEWKPVAVDKCHAILLYGIITSIKPDNVLEIGIGSGFITKTILHALNYNGKGHLKSVDNWYDWRGKEPKHVQELRDMGCNIVAPIEEEVFVKSEKKTYDIIMVDGNHNEGGNWAEDTYRLLNDGGMLFAHDVDQERYPTLKRYIEIAKERKYNFSVFNKNSLNNEECDRGLLMVKK